jgi:hypothetical protein
MNANITEVWKFRSESQPDKLYETLRYDNGNLSCGCPGWTRRVSPDGSRSCKHTRSVEAGTADMEAVAHTTRESKSDPVFKVMQSVKLKLETKITTEPVKPRTPVLQTTPTRKIQWKE